MAKETEAHVIGKCKDCKYWMPEFKNIDSLFGYCTNRRMLNSLMAKRGKSYFYLKGAMTKDNFGCIFFERMEF